MKTLISRISCSLILIAIVVATAPPASTQQATDALTTAPAGAPTINQSLEMRSASAPRISPDGRWVAYEITRTNWESNAFERELWLADTSSARRFRLTGGKGSSSDAQWSPDSKWIAFLSDRPPLLSGAKENKSQIYLIPATGGEARELTKVETGVNSFGWAPDGHSIAFTSTDAPTKGRKDRDEKYGEIQIISGDYSMTQLWMVNLADPDAIDSARVPEPRQLTEGSTFTVGGFSWSPDGTRIAFSAQRDPDLGSADTAAIYVLTVADRAVKKIVDAPGPNTNPVWSPEGTEIAYSTSNANPNFFYTNRMIAVVPSSGGTPRMLTSKFDEDTSPIAWGPDGIYFDALQRTYSHLFRVNPKTGAIDRVSSPDAYIASQFSFAHDYKFAAFVGASDNNFGEVCVSSLRSFSPKALTNMGDQLKGFRPARREIIQWNSTDGAKIEGVLLKPTDFDPAKKYPLLIVIHGGPTGVDRGSISADRYYPMEIFAAKGALILRPNYRGSAGYGEAFRSLNVRNLGVGDYADVISGVDFLIGKGWVDRDRVGAMGWSEGGYISAFITASSDRFKAVSVGAGISDWMTYYVNTDIHPFTRQYLHATPWDDPEIYRKTSPISYVKAAKTPTLIQHGGSDKRVPIPNGFELYQALRDLGVPVRMVVYPGFGHPINKPKQQRSVTEENLRWFGHYIWNEPLPDDIH
ncbi:MAG TPA: S9 family peptidase [Candidatus Acidoferrales bacterium]|nr:S9 family peptidase [Candidatus Acidoferrales bacterium]